MPTLCRPSAATLVAIVVTLAIGTQATLAASSSTKDRSDPRAITSLEVTAADASSVTVEWPPSRFEWKVAGYGVYVGGAKVATVTPDRVHRWRDRDSLSYTVQGLTCGRGYTIGVDVFDREDDRSDVVSTTVSTSACPDTAAPSAPAGVRQVATTESSVMLAWTPSSDNVGVVEYGLYDSGLRVASVSDPTATVTNLACGKTYLLGIDAADAAGNRSARVDSYFKTSACPSTNKPPTTPTVVKVTSATDTTVGLSWTASTDDVGVTGYGLYLSGARTTETTGTTGQFTGLKCGTTYTLAVDAKDAEGLRSAPATLSAATSPCSPTTPPSSSTGSITQTIANGATLKGVVSWYAVYDANGDKVEDDPGSVEWRIDGNLVRTEVDVPFGDDASFWPSTSVANGTHTFEVRAVNGAGTVLAKNTVTATVANTTPSSSTGSITQTIANGATLKGVVSWYAVYDANGDKVEDDPGSVEWRIDGNLVRTEVDVPFGDDASFWPSTSVANGTHTFEVRAVNGAGTVLAKNTVTATVANTTPPPSTGDTVAPSQPANLKVMSASATNVGVAWSPSTDNVGVTAYDVYRGSTLTATTPQTNATLTGLSCGNAYQVGVDANDAAGNSSPPASMAVTTSPCPDSQAPSAPTNVTASSRTTTSIALTWAPATDSVGVAGYGIYNAGELVNTTAGTTGIVSGLTCGTNYTLAVDAFDATGNSSTKTIVMVSTLPCVDTSAPTATSTAPTNGATVSGTINQAVTATDNVGVTKVEFLRDGVVYGQDTTSPYSMSLNTTTVTNGAHTLGARAYDAAGNTGTAANVTVTVANATPDTLAPSVTVSSPTNGATVSGTINQAVTATDNIGVTKVEFLRDGVVYGQDTTSPFTASLDTTTVTNGAHTLGARAYDTAGNVGNATNATVTVSNALPSPGCSLNATTANFATQVAAATAGQIVCLASGNYGTFTGTNKAITIAAASGASPQMRVSLGSGDSGFILDGMTGMGGVISSASNVTIRNSTFADSVDFEGDNSNVVLDHNTHNWDARYSGGINAKIFFAGSNSGTVASPTVTIKNSEIKNGDLDGVHIGGSGYQILNNVFENLCDVGTNHTDNIQFEGGSGIRIAGNYVHGGTCETQGITSYDSGTVGVIIENNVVDIPRPWGIELYSDRDSIVRHNTLVWRADSNCEYTGLTCGQIDINRKSVDPAGTGTRVYDNVTTGVSFSNGSTGTADHNVSGQNAIYVGPTIIHDGFFLAANSPVGKNAASDGTDAGISR